MSIHRTGYRDELLTWATKTSDQEMSDLAALLAAGYEVPRRPRRVLQRAAGLDPKPCQEQQQETVTESSNSPGGGEEPFDVEEFARHTIWSIETESGPQPDGADPDEGFLP